MTTAALPDAQAITHALNQRRGALAQPAQPPYRVEFQYGAWAVARTCPGKPRHPCGSYADAVNLRERLNATYQRRITRVWSARRLGERMTRYVALAGLLLCGVASYSMG